MKLKRIIKKLLRWVLYVVCIPVVYILISLCLSVVTVNDDVPISHQEQFVYLNTNGVHLDIIIPAQSLGEELKSEIESIDDSYFISFGWGDEDFYLNTPAWSDLTFSTAFKAMFLNSSTLMHVTRYKNPYSDWIKIYVTDAQMSALQSEILSSFQLNAAGEKQILKNKGYASNDDFYRANGSYSCFNTCNSWVNRVFKESNMKACLWTPFDFGLMRKYL